MSKQFDPRRHIGEVHGIYTIVDILDQKDQYGHWIYKSVCNECGYERFSHYGQIAGATSRTTSCMHKRSNGMQLQYGYTWNDQRIGKIFRAMVQRCYNENDKNYRWYGEKGIRICDMWLSNPKTFEEWSLRNGYAEHLTIDRVDASKDYSPDNCQWIPQAENCRKAGVVNWITVNENTLTGHQWADKLGIGTNMINTAIRKHGEEKAKELIVAMLKDPPSTKNRKPRQTWFDVYGIQI